MSQRKAAVLFLLLMTSLMIVVTLLPRNKGFQGCNVAKDSRGNCVLTP